MKNKKLFAILTLVCFMMTLMPVAAFAAYTPGTVTMTATHTDSHYTIKVTDSSIKKGDTYYLGWDGATTGATPGSTVHSGWASAATINDCVVLTSEKDGEFTWSTEMSSFTNLMPSGGYTGDLRFFVPKEDYTAVLVDIVITTSDLNLYANAGQLGWAWGMYQQSNDVVTKLSYKDMLEGLQSSNPTLLGIVDGEKDKANHIITMPDAMFNPVTYATQSGIADSMSVVWSDDKKVNLGEAVSFDLKITRPTGAPALGDQFLWAWVTKSGSNIPVNTVSINGMDAGIYVYSLLPVASGNDQFTVKFNAPGEYVVHVSANKPNITSGVISGATEFQSAGNVITVGMNRAETEKYVITTNIGATYYEEDGVTPATCLADGYTQTPLTIEANNVDEQTVEIVLHRDNTMFTQVAGAKIDIEVAGAIETNVDSVYTNALGQAEFKVSGNREGTYKIYLSTGKYESVIEVVVGAVRANSIVGTDATAIYDLLGESDFEDEIEFDMYDVNGNRIVPNVALATAQGWGKAEDSTNDNHWDAAKGMFVDATGYVTFVEKPAASKLENDDIYFDGNTVQIANGQIDAEGVYTFKVVLDNGAYATASVEVREFDKPAKLILTGATNVELGSNATVSAKWEDKNGVQKTAKGIDFAVAGYAVENMTENGVRTTVSVKSDEKYEGSTITVTAVDERYNLIETHEITVAKEARALSFSAETAEVNVNNKVTVTVVDEDGKAVKLNNAITPSDVSYIILEKPEGANVFVSTIVDGTATNKFTMNLTCNKVGNVKVQAVLEYRSTAVGGDSVGELSTNVVKYYTGIQEFAVGTGEIGKSVVMSIGSNELIVGSKVETMDAKPMIQNNRTFVPFRALAEAFGATVAYDQATSSVTAELNGVKVVMTVGAPVYTVNGVQKTADVAPFISDSRTFVPVRFAAEAFGIEVVPTYNEDGSVADVLFNM